MLVFPVLLEIGLDQPLLGTPGLIARIIVSGIETFLNYAASKFIVFRKNKENA
jgi:putative flippase GtrA